MEILALTSFLFTMSFTPGPNVVMITFSGVNFGFKRSIPHMAGITLGFTILSLIVALGVGALVLRFPTVELILRVGGTLYLIYLAARIAMTRPSANGDSTTGRPIGFWEALFFQFINPKGWVTALASAAFVLAGGGNKFWDYFVYTTLIIFINTSSVVSWNLFGMTLRKALEKPGYRKAFNFIMAALVLASAIALFFSK